MVSYVCEWEQGLRFKEICSTTGAWTISCFIHKFKVTAVEDQGYMQQNVSCVARPSDVWMQSNELFSLKPSNCLVSS